MDDLRREIESDSESVITVISGESLLTKELVMESFATALSFPAYFGRNWDALDDCLTDLSWIDAKVVILDIHAAEIMLKGTGETFQKLAGCLEDAVRYWRNPEDANEIQRAVTNFHIFLRADLSAQAELSSFFRGVICDPNLCPLAKQG